MGVAVSMYIRRVYFETTKNVKIKLKNVLHNIRTLLLGSVTSLPLFFVLLEIKILDL